MADRIIALTVSPILPQSLRPCRTAALCGTCWLLIDTFLSSRPYSLARHRVRAAGHRESVSAERQVAEHIAAQRTCCIVWRAAALRICQSQEHNCHIGLKVHFRFWWRMYVPRSGSASHGNVMRSQGRRGKQSRHDNQNLNLKYTRCKAVDLPRPDTPTTEKELPPPMDAARALPCISE